MRILLLLIPLLISCKELEVPFVRQQDGFCGPASLSSVFGFYRIHIPQETIAKSVYHPKLKGALITDLENYARSLGLRAETRKGSLHDIKNFLDKGIPPIILVEMGKFGLSRPHYMVVVGYKEDSFILHTGYEEAKRLSAEELNRLWSGMGRVMLVVYPP
ncbi:MAG: cysteine peptidase family C39 domain-containing protein [Aquificaceae bacterium]|nr:cysteine peptidase family C39 domain-containing protein [Aquificaceae bacterium]